MGGPAGAAAGRAVAAVPRVGGRAAAAGGRLRLSRHVDDGAGGEGLHGPHHPLRQGVPPPAGADLQVRPFDGGRGDGLPGLPHGPRPDPDVQREGGTPPRHSPRPLPSPLQLHAAASQVVRHGVQVYQLSIGAACNMVWPSDRIIIQVLDDSTDPLIKVLLYAAHMFGIHPEEFQPISWWRIII